MDVQVYPIVETVHKNNICHSVTVPADITKSASKKITAIAKKIMQNLTGAGVFGIEMFLLEKDIVLVNELAPRVHNSGHYTIEACATSQFEQHIRSITGLPLGDTSLVVPAAAMVNILGERNGEVSSKGIEHALALPKVTVHLYGKKETRKERKMGHITAVDENVQKALKKALKARKYITI